jgi:hypothetical protein
VRSPYEKNEVGGKNELGYSPDVQLIEISIDQSVGLYWKGISPTTSVPSIRNKQPLSGCCQGSPAAEESDTGVVVVLFSANTAPWEEAELSSVKACTLGGVAELFWLTCSVD